MQLVRKQKGTKFCSYSSIDARLLLHILQVYFTFHVTIELEDERHQQGELVPLANAFRMVECLENKAVKFSHVWQLLI